MRKIVQIHMDELTFGGFVTRLLAPTGTANRSPLAVCLAEPRGHQEDAYGHPLSIS